MIGLATWLTCFGRRWRIRLGLAAVLTIVFGVLIVAAGLPAGAWAEAPVARGYLFYSEKCAHCRAVIDEFLPPLQAKYGAGLDLQLVEIAETKGYEAMVQLEDRGQLARREIPEVFLGDRALVGEDEIRAELDSVVAKCLDGGGCERPAISAGPVGGGGSATIALAYFYTLGCAECDRVKYDLDYLRTRYPNLQVTELEIGAPGNKALNEALGQKLAVPVDERLLTPAVFVGSEYLVGTRANTRSLGDAVSKYAATGASPAWAGLEAQQTAAEAAIAGRFESFGVVPIVAAGLIDGLNPCAFATIIFFVSYLAVAGRRGREILLVGASFTLGVFLAYLLIGLGFLTAIKSLSFLVTIAKVVYLVTAAVCLALAVLSVRDYVRIRRGGLADMALQLPGFLKERVRRTIRERARVEQYVLAAFVSGAIISVLELLCTGQIYLPTIVFVVGVPELRARATAYLVLYNVMFVVPLIGVFFLAYFGTTSRDFTTFLQRRAAIIKLAMAGVFVCLGAWLVYAAL